jgi:hypothetical protein
LVAQLDSSLVSTQPESLSVVTASCLSYEPKGHLDIADVWKCIRGSLMKSSNNALDLDGVLASEKSFQCLPLGKLSSMFIVLCCQVRWKNAIFTS